MVSRLGYRPALDGVRGLAIVAVLCFHAFGWPKEARLGVDLFFALSGFLITVILLGELSNTGTISIRRFYARRARRLLPALLVMLAPYLVLTVGSFPANSGWLIGLGAALTYTTNFFVASGSAMPPGLIHLWSLATEEQFYLVWPLALLLLFRRFPRAIGKTLCGLLLAAVLYRLAIIMRGASAERLYYSPDTHADPLLVGCLFGWLYACGRPYRLFASRLAREIAGWSALTTIAAIAVFAARLTYPTQLVTVFALVAGLLVFCVASGDSWIALALSARPLRFLGQISYSLYLWHLPLLVWFGIHGEASPLAFGAIALAILIATASRRFIELPFLQRTRPALRVQIAAPTAPSPSVPTSA
jgi:peptidoglycan/LPS O-acetylase OafA/YrhL